jgi:uncharacterized membrane protein YuzA (DUF378 family)
MISWFITGFVSFHIGLVAATGYNIMNMSFFRDNLMQFMTPIYYIIGLAGLMSLISLGMMIFGVYGCKCGCSCGGCKCGDNNKRQSGYGM